MAIRQPSAPPAAANLPHLPLYRLPAKASWTLAVTCWELLQVDTHFMGRRTLPCVDENCPGCEANKPRRYEAYLSGVRLHDKRHCIIAVTAHAAAEMLAAAPHQTQLRGHIIDVKRQGTRPNGMLRVEFQEHMVDQNRLPQAPDLMAHLLLIWGLDSSHTAQDNGAYSQAVKFAFSTEGSDDDAQSEPGEQLARS